jgi:O-antigen/teichoic acid export membrane protein
MIISLYTGRVILNALGIVDYGIYNVVGGTVALFSFINLTLTGATSRFLTFELGAGNNSKLKEVFETSLSVHILIVGVILFLAYTVGLWFVYNKLSIPVNRFEAALIAYHVSIFASLLSIMQTPFTASIISHEDMDVYAYVSIFEGISKLIIAMTLTMVSFDKLVFYSILIALVALFVFLIYLFVCIIRYEECCIKPSLKIATLRPILVYSGWDLYGNMSSVARTYGVAVILNLFFGSVINAATGVANQVQSAVMGFVENFMTASRPQIVKLYASNQIEEMVRLIYNASKFSFLLLFLFSFPLIIEADFVLNLWLVQVPPYAIVFTQLSLIIGWNSALFRPIVYGIHSTGKIRNMSIINGSIILLVVPLAYICFKLDFQPYWAYLLNIILLFAASAVNLFQLRSLVREFKLSYFFKWVFLDISKVIIATICFTFPLIAYLDDGWLRFLLILFISSSSVLIMSWFFVADKSQRNIFTNFVKVKLSWRKR